MGLLAYTHNTHGLVLSFLDSVDNAISSSFGARAESFFRLVFPALVLYLGKNTLIEQQISTGRKDLLQASLADSVIGNPQPLVAG